MKKILAFLLALAMLTLVMVAAGCGDTPAETTPAPEKTEGTTTAAEQTQEQTNPTETTAETTAETNPTETTAASVEETTEWVSDPRKDKMPGFEDLDFHGKTFTFETEDDTSTDGWFTFKEVYPDATFTDAISIAVRERNALVEKLYNCKINMLHSAACGTYVNADLTSQKYTVDFYTCEYGMEVCKMYNGNNYNLLNYIETTNPWWDQRFVNTYSIKDNNGTKALCSIVGDFSLSSFRATHALTVNKTVYENCGITDDVYDLVRTGKWTVDKFSEMVKLAKNDTSGDGKFAYADGDTMGWVRTGHAFRGLYCGGGLPIVTNDDGVFHFAMADAADEWTSIVNAAIDTWAQEGTETIGYTNVRLAMEEGKTLFASEIIAIVEYMVDANNLFIGFLPYPKISEAQENYGHYVDNHLAPYGMPVSVTNPELSGQFFEVYAYHSRAIVREAFLNTYSFTYCTDAESYDMLNIILDSRTYEPGYLCWSDFDGIIGTMVSGGTNNVQGMAKRYGTTFNNYNKSLVDRITEKVPN